MEKPEHGIVRRCRRNDGAIHVPREAVRLGKEALAVKMHFARRLKDTAEVKMNLVVIGNRQLRRIAAGSWLQDVVHALAHPSKTDPSLQPLAKALIWIG